MFNAPSAATSRAGLFHHFAVAMTFWAGLLYREKALLHAHLAVAAAGGAGDRLRARARARPFARFASALYRDADFGLGAFGCVF